MEAGFKRKVRRNCEARPTKKYHRSHLPDRRLRNFGHFQFIHSIIDLFNHRTPTKRGTLNPHERFQNVPHVVRHDALPLDVRMDAIGEVQTRHPTHVLEEERN